MACHNGVTSVSGEDVSIGSLWRASMMANSARDPYWQATVRREVMDHPRAAAEIEDECSTCHMPMARYTAHMGGAEGKVFEHLPAIRGDTSAPPMSGVSSLAGDGVSCTMCHQIEADGLGTEESFAGGFVIDSVTPTGIRSVYGPFAVDTGRTRIMHSASARRPTESTHIQQSELCATCHTLYTQARNDEDEIVGRLPEQVPYLEWRHSDYRNRRSCQSCHMPVVREPVPVTSVLGEPRDSVNRHVFRGGNFFMLRMLNRYRAELGVQALPQELDGSVSRTIEHLQTHSAELALGEPRIEGRRLNIPVVVTNLAGHKLPTAYPSRRAWIHLTVHDGQGDVIFESGAFQPNGSVDGNDNDVDEAAYERHYQTIRTREEVQIYEAVMVDYRGNLTTSVTSGYRFIKDNRLLPAGFDKTTTSPDIAVQGDALTDADFDAYSDRVLYSIDVSGAQGPFDVRAELWYQPIGFRWAQNLLQQDAPETRRFVSWYDGMAATSAIVLTTATTRVEDR